MGNHLTIVACWLLMLPCISADWYVSTNGTGNGSIANPWFLQTAITNSSVVAGDTIWIRGGVYFPTSTFVDIDVNVLGWQPTVSGSSSSLITFRSYPNEWAVIDRRWDLKNGGASYLRFRDLEFYDSLKGHNPTNSSYPDGPWSQFAGGVTAGFEWINCIIHDVGNAFGGGAAGNSVRGCVMWNVGWNQHEHVFYGPPALCQGNIVAWEYDDAVEHSFTNMVFLHNIVFGTGNNRSPLGGERDTLFDAGGFIISNYFYNYFASDPPNGDPVTLQDIVGDPDVPVVLSNNVIVGPYPVDFDHTVSNNFSSIFLSNTVYMNKSFGGTHPVINWYGSTAPVTFDYNNWFSVGTIKFSDPGNVGQTFAYWQSFGFDAHGTANSSTAPADMVFVIPNADVAKRAHIAIYNFTHANNVTVDVSSVLASGNTYQLISAQNYNAGSIKTGTLSGTTITVPMTNLSTAPILYGTNVNYQGVSLVQPPPTSPEFGAFVLIGSDPNPYIRVVP